MWETCHILSLGIGGNVLDLSPRFEIGLDYSYLDKEKGNEKTI